MGMTLLTNLKFEPKGAHSSAQSYSVTDTVTSADGSRAYVAVKDVPAGVALTDAAYWVNILDLSDVREAAKQAAADAETAAEKADKAADAGIRTDEAQNLTAAQKHTAQENAGMLEIVRGLTDPLEANGNPVQCEPVGGLMFDGVETRFSPVQAGEGDPYPAGGGKNLLSLLNLTEVKSANVSAYAYDNEINLMVTNNNGNFQQWYGHADVPETWRGKNVTFSVGSFVNENTTGAPVAFATEVNATGEDIEHSIYNPPGTTSFVIAEDTVSMYFLFRADQNKNAEVGKNVWFGRIQFELGSSTDFAPYSNIRPIGGYDSLSLTRRGKNLFPEWNKNSYTMNGVTFTMQADGSIHVQGTADGYAYIELSDYKTLREHGFDEGKYVFSGLPEPSSVWWVDLIATTAGNINFYQNGVFDVSDKIDKEETYAWRIVVRTGYTADLIFKPQVEKGSTPTEYESYQGDTYTVQLGQTVYGGRMNWLTGELTAEWGAVDLGTLSWLIQTWSGFTYFKAQGELASNLNMSFASYDYNQPGAFVCEMYPTKAWNNITSGLDKFLAVQQAYFAIKDMSYPDAASFKAAMAGVMMAYPLAAPATIRLTPQEITSLQGVNTLYGDGDAIHIAARRTKDKALISRIEALEAAIVNTI